MKVGLALPHYDFSFPDALPATVARAVEVARRAETLGYDSVWVSDHLFLDLARYGGPGRRYRALEPLTTLAAAAARTERIGLGTLVLCAAFRPALVLAQAAAALHDLSGGRLELGVGAGWYEAEFAAAGIPFGPAGRRIEHLGGYAAEVREALAERCGDARPAVWVGGKGGPRLARAVAESADGWNVVWRITPEEYRARLEVLRAACADAGRDPDGVRLSVGLTCLLGLDDADLARRYAALRSWMPGGALDAVGLDSFAAGGLVGTPGECALRLKEFASLGVEQVVLSLSGLPFSVYDEEQVHLVAGELLPLVR